MEGSDLELGLECVRAYNDWMIEDWCADSDGHLIPLCLIPLWDVDLAVAEVARNAARGARAICFSEIPTHLGLPSIHTGYWDPLFAMCQETRTDAVHAHRIVVEDAGRVARRAAVDRHHAVVQQLDGVARRLPVLGRARALPELKLAYSEGQIGWIPYALERADNVWEYHSSWTRAKETIPEPPSTYYRGRIFGCFTNDVHGVASIAEVGEDNICFETDYPHTDTTWPFAREEVERMTASLTDEQRYKVLRGNAIRMLDLDRV